MTITTHVGNLLDVPSGILVHGCNAQGVMGSGVAAEVKRRFPQAFQNYLDHSRVVGTYSMAQVGPGKWIVNAITQHDYGRDGARYVSYDAVAKVFSRLRRTIMSSAQNNAEVAAHMSIHFPMIGAGLGGGDWKVIAAIIESEVPDIPLNLWTL